ncbi:MAG: BCCT family transporter [Cyclobacteriaceae bacterium]|nr:BCCT family transporter [Cyclobacteriaceae bacterium]
MRPGKQKNKSKFNLVAEPIVFLISAALIILFVGVTLYFQDSVRTYFVSLHTSISKNFGWLYIIAVNVVLIYCIYLAFSKFGSIRIGGPKSKPEFSTWAWLAMLFNAGIGLVLMFYSIAEPILHFSNPPYGEAGTIDSAKLSLRLSYLHWGFHGWAIYAFVGLAISYFTYNKGLPMGIRWILYPLLGNRLYGPIGHAIDILAVLATMFGLATTLGLGIQHINSGLNYLFDLQVSPGVQVALILLITVLATVSVVSGLHSGIKNLSKIASVMAFILMGFMLIAGPTLFIINSIVQSTGSYIQNIFTLGTWTEVFRGTNWMQDWTIFYWGWWFAWCPFVGMFVARISKGRTIREFMVGVIVGPTLAIIVWIGIFGSTALHIELFGSGGITEAVNENIATAMYTVLEMFPLSQFSILFVVIAGVIFFVTSSDSGSLVIDFITTGGKLNPPVKQRIFWALLEGVVAATLLLGGGLIALQTGSLLAGLPVCVLVLVAIRAFHKSLRQDLGSASKNSNGMETPEPVKKKEGSLMG